MGREVRRVPPHWEHPKKENGSYHSMVEEYYETALNKWIEDHNKWMNNVHPDQLSGSYVSVSKYKYLGNWESPPNADYYNTYYKPEEATWYQYYETVSEGTPLSPPFETKEELAQYLAENGDFNYQDQENKKLHYPTSYTKPTLEQARKLVDAGWAPSLIISDGQMMNVYEQQDLKND